jgi:TonB family protein
MESPRCARGPNQRGIADHDQESDCFSTRFLLLPFRGGIAARGYAKIGKDRSAGLPCDRTKMRVEGTVKLDATIDPDGSVSDVKVVSGHQPLVPAAVDAVKKWKYESGGGKSIQPVSVEFALPR